MTTRMVYGDDDNIYIDHEGMVRKTDKAVLYKIHGETVWIPKSVIDDYNDEVVAVKKWWASKNGLESDW